ncbi:ADP-ribosylglycohydrolase family protein [Massilia atriviolacea]|uniref:ADP-ribosylglycohydrolase family protein n=1 Tax=Massilia atriviolacea TaxID=2495579 RepID=A0A430HFE6_9BURK|nr:ADP-ribosylglycohydrolase family protein [Massilia atriviolacea]RSZ56241.1 ADP-ribosylglycohydrolase family protein [Massilia atriviolacea]
MSGTRDRYRGSLLGLACGDAVGTTVEFSPRGSFAQVTDMTGGGPFRLKAGQWTDDTSMALCLAESLLTKGAFDPQDQINRYRNWWQWGYLSSTGSCFDIGMTVQDALSRYAVTGEPYSGSTNPRSAGNGSLMRLAPAVLFAYPDRAAMLRHAADSSRTTHGAPEAVQACQLFAAILGAALDGLPKSALLANAGFVPGEPKLAAIAGGAFLGKADRDIQGTGYAVDALEAALWCFFHTDSFEAAVLRAANLGDDADTTAAIAGQIAGAWYGVDGIPARWLERISMRADIDDMACRLFDRFHDANRERVA